ncbi:hypothetical protein NE235_09680 [Actinoallomurus spadix]|uniref:hypothetical protein n=1 Tax=Actinoallomurus spadix TaxID=79912 RepID=UPI00209306D2|nr:hypothetical protein [Actinoallomurus spadix]MCO5986376.1 hypothetical protein [Actinoallomurus spadix]
MSRRTPQEKKRLSYAKDRRGSSGYSFKPARRWVPARKRRANRVNRRRARRDLLAAKGRPDADAAYAAEERLLARRPEYWQKPPEMPLGVWVERILERRAGRDERDVADRERLDRLRRRLRRPRRSPTDAARPFPY